MSTIVSGPRAHALIAAAALALIPAHAVMAADAHLAVVSGNVTVQHEGGAPAGAGEDTPVAPGDFVNTGAGGRGELRLDGGASIRLGDDTQLRLAHLDAGERVVQLASGTIAVVVSSTGRRTEIDTPSIALRAREPGRYRVTVSAEGKTVVTVRSGEADLVTPQRIESLRPGTTLFAEGPSSAPRITTGDALASDAFDAFGADRDPVADEPAPPESPALPARGVETLTGTIVQVASLGRLLLHDDRGFDDRISLSPVTVIDGGGVALVPGRRIVIVGVPSGSTFAAQAIHMPSIPSYAHPEGGYGYGPSGYAPYPAYGYGYPVTVRPYGYGYGYGYRPAYSVGLFFRFR